MLCGSDVPALLSRTREVVFLEDGDLVELRPEGYSVERLGGGRVERPVRRIEWSAQAAEKGGHKHFMQKEIFEQPEVVAATLRGRVDLAAGDVLAADMGLSEERARAVGGVLAGGGFTANAAVLERMRTLTGYAFRLVGAEEPAVLEALHALTADLMRADDGTGLNRSFIGSEANYRVLRDMQQRTGTQAARVDCDALDLFTTAALQRRAFDASRGIAPHFSRRLLSQAGQTTTPRLGALSSTPKS